MAAAPRRAFTEEGAIYERSVQGRSHDIAGRTPGMAHLDVYADDAQGGRNPTEPHSLEDPAAPGRRSATRPWGSPARGAGSGTTCPATFGRPHFLAASEPRIGPLPGAPTLARISRTVTIG